MLELPNSVKLLVNKIDYSSQVISASDPQGALNKLVATGIALGLLLLVTMDLGLTWMSAKNLNVGVMVQQSDSLSESKASNLTPVVTLKLGLIYLAQKERRRARLPNSVKLLVKNIDYVAQVIYTSDPQDCLPRQLSNFNLSASSFRFRDIGLFNDQSSLFNCSWRKNTFFQMPCLSAPGYQVYVFSSRVSMDNIALLYCAKMYDVSLVPDDMIDGNNILHLNWSIPSVDLVQQKANFAD
ncbi:hypothetical protein GH714_019071 [Hevea brasiliensis]|uniref:RING-type E3 ubiquitin transferase n=1 Tax=Hevea brasiliensis TaxID=3981 RepID=A0A6A6NCD4_HEVBR|nr:hypothetical protein GH714_019071 [Hevea brasiliensis]